MIFDGQRQPHPHHIIHHHIKQGWWYDPTLRRHPSGLKVYAVVTVLSCDDLLVDPEVCKDLSHMGPRSVALQGPDEAASVCIIVGLPQVEEY